VAPIKINIVSAQSGTGKTTVLEKLLPELTGRGLKVAALKGEIHHYNLDLPGKDTWRFAQAGAITSGMTTPDKYILIGSDRERGGMSAALNMLQDLDLVLIEGDKKSGNPKIEVVRREINKHAYLPEHLIAVVTDVANLEAPVPVFGLDEAKDLASFIYDRFFTRGDAGDEGNFTHFDRSGRPRMVDLTGKEETLREAYARGEVVMNHKTLARLKEGKLFKGDVLGVAQVAAIMAVKETGRLIPMAHPLNISGVEVDFTPVEDKESRIEIGVRVKLSGKTGVEMEALTGVSVAALTIYDMCKAVDKSMVIRNIRLLEKKGGRSGQYRREE